MYNLQFYSRKKLVLSLLCIISLVMIPMFSFANGNVTNQPNTKPIDEMTDDEIIGEEWKSGTEKERLGDYSGTTYERFTGKTSEYITENSKVKKLKKGYVDEKTGRSVLDAHTYSRKEKGHVSCNMSGCFQLGQDSVIVYVDRIYWSLKDDEKQEYNKGRNELIEFKNSLSSEEYNKRFTENQRNYIERVISTNADEASTNLFNRGFKVAKFRMAREKEKINRLNADSCMC